jgi:general secretion pathway protein G
VVCALVGVLSAMGFAVGFAALKHARVTRAIGDLRTLDTDIRMYHLMNGRYPTTLADVRTPVPNDPWGHPYRYTDLSQIRGKGKARKDRRLNPINADFDLYSVGEDGRTATPLTAAASKDDIIRAREGAFFGLASEF